MQDYVALSPQEQMTMKGGMTPYQWVYTVYTAWKLAGEINDVIKGSGGSAAPFNRPQGNIYIQEADSVFLPNGISIYGSSVICIPGK